MKMTHPESDLELDVEPEQVYQYATQGWEAEGADRPAGKPSTRRAASKSKAAAETSSSQAPAEAEQPSQA